MTLMGDIRVIKNAIENIDTVTVMRNEEIDTIYDIEPEDETWSTNEYKNELFCLLGKKVYEKSIKDPDFF